jgi:hypothetical protein
MPTDRERSRVLHELAEAVVDAVPLEAGPGIRREDLVTSLVRQWVTYDGNGTFLSGEEQVYFILTGERSRPEDIEICKIPTGEWFKRLMRDWDFEEERLAEIVPELNLGQSGVLENRRGRELRVWIDPKEHSKGIEPLEPEQIEVPKKRNYCKIAQDSLEQVFGDHLPPDQMGDLVTALVRQWLTCDGYGMILTPQTLIRLDRIPMHNGGCRIDTRTEPIPFGDNLVAAGLSPDAVVEIVHRLNLDQTPEITDSLGQRYRLVADAKNHRVAVEPLDDLPQFETP